MINLSLIKQRRKIVSDKLFTVVAVTPESSSIRIALDSSMELTPGEKYRERKMPNGVSQMIPEAMGIPGEPEKADYKEAVIESCKQIREKVTLLNSKLDAITALIKET
jgi:hypothetical protein